jgi:hypothetical protein
MEFDRGLTSRGTRHPLVILAVRSCLLATAPRARLHRQSNRATLGAASSDEAWFYPAWTESPTQAGNAGPGQSMQGRKPECVNPACSICQLNFAINQSKFIGITM